MTWQWWGQPSDHGDNIQDHGDIRDHRDDIRDHGNDIRDNPRMTLGQWGQYWGLFGQYWGPLDNIRDHRDNMRDHRDDPGTTYVIPLSLTRSCVIPTSPPHCPQWDLNPTNCFHLKSVYSFYTALLKSESSAAVLDTYVSLQLRM